MTGARRAWRPIASAPHDGQTILVRRRVKPWTLTGRAHWDEGHWLVNGGCGFDPELGEPTHWQPIEEAGR